MPRDFFQPRFELRHLLRRFFFDIPVELSDLFLCRQRNIKGKPRTPAIAQQRFQRLPIRPVNGDQRVLRLAGLFA